LLHGYESWEQVFDIGSLSLSPLMVLEESLASCKSRAHASSELMQASLGKN
jgi:hypothetical protein